MTSLPRIAGALNAESADFLGAPRGAILCLWPASFNWTTKHLPVFYIVGFILEDTKTQRRVFIDVLSEKFFEYLIGGLNISEDSIFHVQE